MNYNWERRYRLSSEDIAPSISCGLGITSSTMNKLRKMTQALHAAPLSISAFTPYGGVISTDVTNLLTVQVNGGTTRRTPEVVPTSNLYHLAPSQKAARIVLNASLAGPRDVFPYPGSQGKRVFKLSMLERHRFTTQSFVPMGGNVKYLVVVTDGDEKPNIDGLKAFVAGEKQGICYGVGVWHAPMAVIDEPVSFAVVQHVNGVADEDCQTFPLDEEIEVIF